MILKTFWNYLVAKQNILYKSILILSSSLLILYLFPIGGQFKYEFQKGRAWQYPSYYAPFDFSILKSEQEVKADQEAALSSLKPYLRSDIKIKELVFTRYQDEFSRFFSSINKGLKHGDYCLISIQDNQIKLYGFKGDKNAVKRVYKGYKTSYGYGSISNNFSF